MRRALLLLTLICGVAGAADPVHAAWIMASGGSAIPSLPEVHSVSAGERFVTVRSAGVSLAWLGPLQLAPVPTERLQQFEFRIPVHPEPEPGRRVRVPVGSMPACFTRSTVSVPASLISCFSV